MPRKQDRYADKAANQIRINGETITAGQNVRENAERTGDRPVDSLRRELPVTPNKGVEKVTIH